MRIENSQSTDPQGFWPKTRRWLRTRSGFAQFLLAAGIGFALAAGIGLWYKLGGWQIVDPPVRALLADASETINTALETNDLPNLYFDIGFEEYQILAAQRAEALATGILQLEDEDWLRAEIRFQGETIPVRIRLKGDWVDHLKEDKWSFRVKTRNDASLLGMRSFSVQSPDTRRYLNEWLYMEDLRRADILAPRYSFLNVYVNGEDWGVYALEESFSKELLESLGRREGVIVRFSESLFWERRALYGGAVDERWKYAVDPIATTLDMQAFSEVDEFNTNKIQSDPVLSEQSTTALGLLRGFQSQDLLASQVFDAELMGRYLAHTNLWGARHSLTWHNERYYYNPLTSHLEPIGYDALPLEPRFAHLTDVAQYNDLAIMEAYAQEVRRIAQPEYVQELQAAYAADFQRYYDALAEEFPPNRFQPPWDQLVERQGLLVNALRPPQTVYAYETEASTDSTLEIEVANILRYPIALQRLQVGDQTTDVQMTWVAEADHPLLYQEEEPDVILRRAQGPVPRYVTLQVPTAVIDMLLPTDTLLVSNTLQIVTSLHGAEHAIVVDVRRNYPPSLLAPEIPAQPPLEEALDRHPFLTMSKQPGFLEVLPGEWEVVGDLVLPDGFGLRASQPVSLTFEQGAILFSNGPLLLQGPTTGSIYLGPQDGDWAGIIVLQAGSDQGSILHNVEIRATSGISRGGWITTGGVTFYESSIVLSNSRLLDSRAEDAINVVRTQFEFVDTEFGNIASDAFDGDFTQGTITDCAFHDVRGDGIDVSGSNIRVRSVSLLRIHDKGLSVGEGSIADVSKLYASNVGIAIASKDMSTVTAEEISIERAWIAGLAAFLKKMEYGPASIQASQVVFGDDSPRTLVQRGSGITIDGEVTTTTELDVPALYSRLEALGRMDVLDLHLGPDIRLVGYEMRNPEPGGDLQLALYWQADAKPDQDYTVFVHVVDESGSMIAQRDNMPQNDALPTTRWPVGQLVDDPHLVTLPPDIAAGTYQVLIGMYEWQTGERLPVHLSNGDELPDGAVVLPQPLRVDR
jgi:hypothetical protein